MPRRLLLLLPAMLAALALPVAPALAGEDDDDDGGGGTGTARLNVVRGCVSGDRAVVVVTGRNIDTVTFLVDGNRIRTVNRPAAGGRFAVSMRCARFGVGAHRARAVVNFTQGTTPARQSLAFQITRSRQGSPQRSPQFTG